MGVGKTTVGKLIADEQDVPFVDTDVLIEEQEKMSINEIFAASGEKTFRAIERAIIQSIQPEQRKVVSLGGGTLHQPGMFEWIQQHFVLIVLQAEWDLIQERLRNTIRPLANKAYELYLYRKPMYEKAPFVIHVDDKEAHQVANECLQIWKRCA